MVKLTIIWDNTAKTELRKLYEYIKCDSSQNASGVRNDIIGKVKHAAVSPESCSPDKYKTDNDGSFRAFEIHRYRISYKVTANEIIVLRIRHTSQSPLAY